MRLSEVTRHFRATDACTLVRRAGHVLWETVQLPHCSSRAAWQQYRDALDGAPEEDWLKDSTGTMGLWFDCTGWRVYRDAVDRMYLYLRQQDVPVNDATISSPVVQRRTIETQVPFLRGKSPLCVYVQIDFDGSDSVLEFESGESVALTSGNLVLVSGFRRHRISGPCHLLAFQIQLPAVARPTALQSRALHDAGVLDTTVFAAATAIPLSDELAPPELLMEKINWLHARWMKKHRHLDCPSVQRFLIDNQDPQVATVEDLDRIRNHGRSVMVDGTDGSSVLQTIPVLTSEQCATLRQFADDHMTSIAPDSVDDQPEYQIDLSRDALAGLVGEESARELTGLSHRFGIDRELTRLNIFLRMYSPEMRPYISFHSDNCSITANVALNSDDEFVGGRLVTVNGDSLQIIPRQLGSALVHCSKLVHGVSRIEQGQRYTLILFFHHAGDEDYV